MSSICVGYFKIKKNRKLCIESLTDFARYNGFGILFDNEVHSEEFLAPYRNQSCYVVFSIVDNFEFDTCHKIFWSDLCRDPEQISLKENITMIVKLIEIMLQYTNIVDLFWGSWGCFETEYLKQYVSPQELFNLWEYYINNDIIQPYRHFIVENQN